MDARRTPLEQWQEMRSLLIERERQFSELAVQHGMGKLPVEELDRAHREVLALREEADRVFRQAFGVNRRK